jgi:hypothetical protein
MLNNTRLAVIQFSVEHENHIRVYYQDEQNLIKESCFDDSNGWHTRKDDVVTEQAKRNSPIAVMSRNGGEEVGMFC